MVSTASDPQGRTTVVSLVRSDRRLYPVGRLDIDTTGLMLLTNDGALAHRLTHPSFEVRKTYRVVVRRGPVTGVQLAKLREGVQLEDGRTAPAEARRVAHDMFELTIHEGRNRQVKRMCEAVGHRVKRLERIAFGPLVLGDLAVGRSRRLSAAETTQLSRVAAGSNQPTGTERHGGPTIPVSGPPDTPRRNGANAPAMTVGAVSRVVPDASSAGPGHRYRRRPRRQHQCRVQAVAGRARQWPHRRRSAAARRRHAPRSHRP